MNPVTQTPAPRRRLWRWLLIGTGLCLAPFVILAVVAASYLTLDRDAAILRRHVMTATNADWHTNVQMTLGRATINAVNFGLGFVDKKDVADARGALAAVGRASVGVYRRTSALSNWSRTELFVQTDQAMLKRGWVRLVGVVDGKDTVLIYVSQDMQADKMMEVCLAVVSGDELVVASTKVDAMALAEFVKHHAASDLKGRLKLANYSFRS